MKYIRSYQHLCDGKFTDEFKEEIFNLKEDISESNNLRQSAEDELIKMRGLLEAWEKEVAEATS
jgi:hypothetical protein